MQTHVTPDLWQTRTKPCSYRCNTTKFLVHGNYDGSHFDFVKSLTYLIIEPKRELPHVSRIASE